MLVKSGLFLFMLTVLQVSARYKNVVPESKEDVIELEAEALSPSSRILSGWEAQPGQLPHHASIRMVSPAGTVGRCGGAIVSRRWVLTAAQCTAGRVNLIVRVGVVSISDNNQENIFETTEWYSFPTFDDLRPTHVQPNDITLVRLQRPVVYSRLVQPIRVQSSADAYRDYDGEQVYVSGHGRTSTSVPVSDVLRWVYLRAISNTECAKSFASGTILNTIVCAQFFNVTSQTACQGDFGGPLVHVGSDGVPTLIGLFVFTTSEDNACPRGLPTGYTRPGPYLPWFQQITGLNFENLQEEDDEEVEVTTTPATSTTTPSTSITSTTTPSTTPSTIPSTSTISPSTPTTTPYTSTTNPSTSTTYTITPSTSTTSTSTSTTTPSTSTTNPSTFTTSIVTPSTSTSTTTAELPDESTTAPPNDSEEQEPDDVTPEENTSAPPEDSEEKEEDIEDEEEDSDSSECNENDDMGQLLKRLQVNVRVKVRFEKYNVTNAAGKEISVAKH